MNILVSTQTIAQELRALNSIAPAKPSLPILTHTRIQAEGNALHFYATDCELGLMTGCPAQVNTPGIIAVPVQRLLSMVEQLPAADMQLELRGAHVYLTCGDFRSRLQVMPAEGFPAMPEMAGERTTLNASQFAALIARTRHCIAEKNVKYTINGALCTFTEKFTAMVATDGKRLSVASMPGAAGPARAVIIPSKCLDAVASMFTESSVVFSQSGNHLFFADGRHLLFSRMLEGQFPAYERIVPKEDTHQHKAVVDRAALAAALRRVGLVAGESMATIFSFTAGALELSSSSAEVGDAAERLAVSYGSEDMKICCSWRYVLDFLEAAQGQAVEMLMRDDRSPILFRDGSDYLAVVMAMRG